MSSRRFFVPALVLLAAAVLSCPLLTGGYLKGHDGQWFVLWFHQFIESVHSGVLHPSWAADTNAGGGSATFIFYFPLPLYLAAAASVFVSDVPRIVAILAGLGLAGSGITMYLSCRVLFRRWVSALCAVIYMALPYRLLDLYVRVALAESLSFVWLPLLFLFLYRLDEKRPVSFAGASLSFALLLLTHLPIAMVTAGFMLVVFLAAPGGNRWALFARRGAALLLGAGVAAFYLVPAYMERWFVNVDFLFEGINAYEEHFLFPGNFFEDYVSWMAVSAATILMASLVCRLLLRNTGAREGPVRTMAAVMSVAGLATLFLMTPWSRSLWSALPVLYAVKYPWRLLVLTTFAAALCAGYVTELLLPASRPHGPPRRYRAPAALLVGLLIVCNLILSVRVMLWQEAVVRPDGAWSIRTGMSHEELVKNYGAFVPENNVLLDTPEWWPRWAVSPRALDLIKYDPGMAEGQIAMKPLRGSFMDVKVLRWDPEERFFSVRALVPSRMLVKTYYYPSWEVRINGVPASISPDPRTGYLAFDIPAGRVKVELLFKKSTYQRAGEVMSLLSLAALAVLCLRGRTPARRRGATSPA
jgi:hypothetical protein